MKYIIPVLSLFLFSAVAVAKQESTCYGSPEEGKIENAWQLPDSAPNFLAYSYIGTSIGRNYVHSKAYKTILDAYRTREEEMPGKVFVCGETGWKNGASPKRISK